MTIKTREAEVIHYGPNPCDTPGTTTFVNAAGEWNESETARPARITCGPCKRKNRAAIKATAPTKVTA